MKYLSLYTIRIVSILLSLLNIAAFFYFGNIYDTYIAIAFVCILFQVVIFVFYLLFHIYYVWLNETLLKVRYQQDLNAKDIQNIWKSIEGKHDLMTALLKKMEDGVISNIRAQLESLAVSFSRSDAEKLAYLRESREIFVGKIKEAREMFFKELEEFSSSLATRESEKKSLLQDANKAFSQKIEELSRNISQKEEEVKSLFNLKLSVLSEEFNEQLQKVDKGISDRNSQLLTEYKKNIEELNGLIQGITSSLQNMEESQFASIQQLSDEQQKIIKDAMPSLGSQLEEVSHLMARADQLSNATNHLNSEFSKESQEIKELLDSKQQEALLKSAENHDRTLKLLTDHNEQNNTASEKVNQILKQDILSGIEEIKLAENLKQHISFSISEVKGQIDTELKSLSIESKQDLQNMQKYVLQNVGKVIEDLGAALSEKVLQLSNQSYDLTEEQLRKIQQLVDAVVRQSANELLKLSASQQSQEELKKMISTMLHDFDLQYKALDLGIKESGKLVKTAVDDAGKVNEKIDKSFADQRKFVEFNIYKHSNLTYERIDALLSIHNLIDLNSPLPIMHEWTISSDYANEILRSFLTMPDGNALDIGSGISTLLLGYAAKKKGKGKVISIEHSKEYFKKTLKLIREHKLEDFCELNYCPLKTYKINNQDWLWYDLTKVKIPNNIRLVSIDGPPGATQALARYPALPLLNKFFDKQTIIYLDDGNREDETNIAETWVKDFSLDSALNSHYKGFYKFNLR